MPTEDKASDETPGPPHPRRDDRRPPPLIEGTAQEIPDPPGETAPQDSEPEDLAPAAGGGSPEEPAAPRKRLYASAGLLPLAALFLALWALLGAGALWVRTIYPSPKPGDQAQSAALASQVGALRTQMATVQSLESRVAALETTVKSAAAAADAARADASKALAAANAVQAAAAQRAATAKLPASASVAPAQSAALGERLVALERRPDPQAIANQLSTKISDLDQKAASLASALDGLDKRISGLDAQLGDQAKRLTPLEALLRAPKVDVAAIDARTAQAVDEAQAAALIVAARALQQAVDSGAPFARETVAAAKLGADPAFLKPLQASAAAGVATSSELSQAFAPLIGPILAGVAGPDRGGVFDRLAREAGSLVQIRTVGQTSGDSLPAVVGRIESALARGDVAAALKARNLLPDAAKTMTEDWAQRARARLAAQQAAQALLDGAMDRLGKART